MARQITLDSGAVIEISGDRISIVSGNPAPEEIEAVMLPIERGSLWRNLKKGTVYIVWEVVADEEGDRFVIYKEFEESKEEGLHRFYVRHSENNRLGFASFCTEFTPHPFRVKGWDWNIQWIDERSVQLRSPGDLLTGLAGADAWARPIALWHEKFEYVEGSASTQVKEV